MGETLEVAKGISDYGVTIVICAVFLVLSSGLMTACFQWFKKLINDMMEGDRRVLEHQQEKWEELLEETRKQNEILEDLREGHIQETQTRIRSLAGFAFDLAVEQACHLIRRTKEENHIDNRAATHEKISKLVALAHKNRAARFSAFIYGGRPLSQYFSDEWVDKVINTVEECVYNGEEEITARTYTNLKLLYDEIKTEFFHNLKID